MGRKPRPPAPPPAAPTEGPLIEALHVSGVRGEIPLLALALTHRSAAGASATASNERLEFLGDAVLAVVVSERLYTLMPGDDEGVLSRVRALVIRERSLAAAATRLALHELVVLPRSVRAAGIGRRESVLADAFEAVVASVFLACGLDLARAFVLRCLEPELIAAASGALEPNHKADLQELLQGRALPLPSYDTVAEDGPPHDRRFTVEVRGAGELLGVGRGLSKQQAEQEAAGHAMHLLAKRPESCS